MKRRIVSFALALTLVFGLSVSASAYTDEQNRAAEALYHLGLFYGRSATTKDFDLDNSLNRAEGALMVIRLLGKEEEAYTRDLANTPFPDVANFWNGKAPFIAYAYEEGLMGGVSTYANGVTTLTFEPRMAMNDRMFLTLVLRVLGYPDENDYIWKNAWTLAHEAGLVDSTEKDTEFTRGDATLVAWKVLDAKLYGSNKTLADKLRGEGLFTAMEYAEAKEIWNYGYVLDDTPTTPTTPNVPDDSETDDTTTPSVPDDSGTDDSTTPSAPDDSDTDSGTAPSTPDNSGSDDTTTDDTTTPDSGDAGTTEPEESDEMTYEKYIALSGAEQQAFMETFESVPAFFDWYNAAKAEYEANREEIEIGGDGTVDLGDLINGQNG